MPKLYIIFYFVQILKYIFIQNFFLIHKFSSNIIKYQPLAIQKKVNFVGFFIQNLTVIHFKKKFHLTNLIV